MTTDTSTTINPASLGGGDTLDESSVVQSDGATTVKRARVDVGFQADDKTGRLVSARAPLPVESSEAVELLKQIAADLRELKTYLINFTQD